MLSVKETGILKSIINHCIKIESKLSKSKITIENFDKDDDDVQLIAFNILQIGELAKNLSPEFITAGRAFYGAIFLIPLTYLLTFIGVPMVVKPVLKSFLIIILFQISCPIWR